MGMTIYISGPMTGYENNNFPAFWEAEQRLRDEGYEVINPARNFGGRTDLPRTTYLREDIKNLLAADGVYMLEGWAGSEGAKTEYQIAMALELPVRFELSERLYGQSLEGEDDEYVEDSRDQGISSFCIQGSSYPKAKQQTFLTGACRDNDDDKPRPDLISPYAVRREAELMRHGAEQYRERNWQKGMPFSRVLASLQRHVLAYRLGCNDEDHLAAIRANAGFLAHYEEGIQQGWLPGELDDRTTTTRTGVTNGQQAGVDS